VDAGAADARTALGTSALQPARAQLTTSVSSADPALPAIALRLASEVRVSLREPSLCSPTPRLPAMGDSGQTTQGLEKDDRFRIEGQCPLTILASGCELRPLGGRGRVTLFKMSAGPHSAHNARSGAGSAPRIVTLAGQCG